MDKKKLLIITSTFPRWQNDTDPPFVFELAKRLTGDFDITVLAPNYPGALPNEIMENIKIHRFRYFLKNHETLAGSEGILPTLKMNKIFYLVVPFFILAEFGALLKLIKKTKPHVIHAHWLLPQGLVAALAKKITGVPYVITVHGSDIHGIKSNLANSLKRYILQNATRVTVVSRDIQQTIKQKLGDNIKTQVVSMGVDSQLFHPDNKDLLIRKKHKISGPFLLYVGRLTEVKGVRYLIKAMPNVLKHFAETKLLIIGKGELQQELKHMTESLAIQDKVIFAGAIPNIEIPKYYATADIFIGPSIHSKGGEKEGFGLTFVEAGMSGCIVVASEVGGISDIIEHAKTGFLIKEKDPDQLAETITMIIAKMGNFENMKKAARETLCNKFDWTAIAEKYNKILALK